MNALPLSQIAVQDALTTAGLPAIASPQQFWAVVTWLILPSLVAIWTLYRRREDKLRRTHRRLRQLEARLAMANPTQVPAPSPFLRPASTHRPSSLTARILLPASADQPSAPTFSRPLPGQGV